MELHVKGKNLEVSDAIRSYAERKLSKLDKQLSKLARVEVELTVEKNPSIAANQVAEATVWLKGHTLRARESTRDMKASIDELTEKLLRQVKDERDRKAAKRKPARPAPSRRGGSLRRARRRRRACREGPARRSAATAAHKGKRSCFFMDESLFAAGNEPDLLSSLGFFSMTFRSASSVKSG